MFCSNCGNQISDALKYCNSCGAKQKKGKDRGAIGQMLDDVLTTLFLVVMFGLGIFVGLIAVLLENNLPPQLLGVIAIGYLGAVFAICFMLMAQAKRLISANLDTQIENEARSDASPLQMPAKSTARLEQHYEPAVSVVEHTTRDLDLVERKR